MAVMRFKTFSGAAKRAEAERWFARRDRRPVTFKVVSNTNSHQVAQGFVWAVKKVKL